MVKGPFEAAAEAVEESISNTLCMAESMKGPNGVTAEAIDSERLKRAVAAIWCWKVKQVYCTIYA